jgi:hypothetical protein
MDEKPIILEKVLKLNLAPPPDVTTWLQLESQDYLARFLRTLSAGARSGDDWGWSVQPLLDGGQFGWSATCARDGRAYIVHLTTEVGPEPLPSTLAWTLMLLAEPSAGVAPRWNSSVGCSFGIVLGLVTYIITRSRIGDVLGLLAGFAVLVLSGLVLPIAVAIKTYRRNPDVGHPTDKLLLDSLRAGIENFAPFRLASRDWEDEAV